MYLDVYLFIDIYIYIYIYKLFSETSYYVTVSADRMIVNQRERT
jgi:hypothetical protein